RQELREQRKSEPEIVDTLAREFGYFEVPSKEIVNYHTQAITIPKGLFQSHFAPASEAESRYNELLDRSVSGALTPEEQEEFAGLEGLVKHGVYPPLKVRVRCLSRTQFLGMAKYDLYLLDAEQPFWLNFFKGAAGIWFSMVLVIALATVCS